MFIHFCSRECYVYTFIAAESVMFIHLQQQRVLCLCATTDLLLINNLQNYVHSSSVIILRENFEFCFQKYKSMDFYLEESVDGGVGRGGVGGGQIRVEY